MQDAQGYAPLGLRNAIVPLASFGSNATFFLFIIGALINSFGAILLGIALFSATVLFQVVNLPVEFNASTRAKEILVQRGIVAPGEIGTVGKVLNAAAWTYVAATLTAILTLLYYLYRFGLNGGDSD